MRSPQSAEKAKELYDKFETECGSMAKQCALICVEEVIAAGGSPTINYWLEVKSEIEKL